MFAIEFFCGRKYGGWIRSSGWYTSAEAATRAIREQVSLERRADMTPMQRRAVAV